MSTWQTSARTSRLRVSEGSRTEEIELEAGAVDRPEECSILTAVLRYGVCATYVAFITWLSLTPTRLLRPLLSLFPQADKVAHFLMYGFLVLLLRWASAGCGMRWRPQGLWVPFAALVYGALMEVAQSLFLPADRSFEVWDMAANGLGALAFWAVGSLWSSRRLRAAAPIKQDGAANRVEER
jgi:VanZ family protein